MNEETQIQKAAQMLEKEFGSDWITIAQALGTENLRKRVGKELTSFMAFPERGTGGDNKWRGNCSPEVVKAAVKHVLDAKRYYRKPTKEFTILDPMSGSGTTQSVAKQLGVKSILYDLNPAPAYGKGNWNALKNDVEDSADLIFFHPPYHSIIHYSGNVWGKPHPDDLSRCENYNDFIEKLNFVIQKLFLSLRKDGRLAVLVGDIRRNGEFHSIQNDMMKIGNCESFIVKGQFNCVSDNRTYKNPFIPIVTEYMWLFHKEDIFMVPFSFTLRNTADLQKQDAKALTWHHLIRFTLENCGGSATLTELYQMLEKHPKAQRNPHYKERIRATIYEHRNQYVNDGAGVYRLTYQVA